MDTQTTTAGFPPEKDEEVLMLIDRGRASQATKGFAFQVLFELGAPPFNTRFG